jgi:DNA-binding beta-propeller fold protein YncE
MAVERVTHGCWDMGDRALSQPACPRAIARTLLIMVVTLAGLFSASASARAAAWTALAPDAQSASMQVTPIDLGTNVAGSPLDTSPAFSHLGVAISPDGRTGYVVSAGSHVLIPIDLSTGFPTVETPVNLTASAGTLYIAISPDGRKAYVSDTAHNDLVPVDLTTNPVTVGTPIPIDATPFGIAFSPDGSMAYVAAPGTGIGNGTVTPITVASDTPGTPISGVGTSPYQIAITPDGKTAYVTDNGSNNVYPIALPAGTVGPPISVGAGVIPLGIAITPDGTKAYTANFGAASTSAGTGNTVTPITLATNTAGTPITVGGGPWSIAVTPDSKTVYVGNSNDSTVSPIDVATDTAGTAITGVGFPRSLAITPDQAPVANFAVASASPGQPTTFDASSSTVRFGTIASYRWDFGDGSAPVTTTAPTTSHVYAGSGSFTASVTETSSAGTSIGGEVYTGQTASRVGSAGAQASRSVIISAAPQPAVSVSAHSLDFGVIAIGHTSLPQAITVTNSGQAPLVISSAVLAGTNKRDYKITSDTCSGHTISASGACTTTLTFTPGGTGARAAQLAYDDNGSGSPHTIALSGSGTHRVTLAGTVTLNGNPVAGAAVEACPTGAAGQANCVAANTARDGGFAVTITAPTGAQYSLSAFAPSDVHAGEKVLSPITVPAASFSGLEIALPAAPSIPSGVTFVSPSHGVETSGSANPAVFWNEPNQIELDRSLFPPNGTVVVTQIIIRGTNASTGAPASDVVNVGGTVAGRPVGVTFGNGPVSVTIPPLDPIHGQATATVNYQFFPSSTFAATGIASTQALYEVYPPPPFGQALAPQPTDPLPAYFLNIGQPGGVALGPASISGTDAKNFSVVTLGSAGVPKGSTDCGFTAAMLQPFDQTTSNPPPSSECGVAVQFTPPPLTQAPKIFYYATLDVAARSGGATGGMHVQLIGCDEDQATAAANFTGIDACGGSNPPEKDEPPEDEPPPPPEPDPTPVIIPFPWIDPSGTVLARSGHGALVPLPGATVTLQRGRRRRRGPFGAVRNRSTVMSPANRRNPDRTSALGAFGWDVLPGYYRVAASHPGCKAAKGKSALSSVLRVPPPALGLRLVLACPHLRRAVTHTTLRVSRHGKRQLVLLARVRGRHPAGVVSFLLGRRSLAVVPVDPRSGRATLTLRGTRTKGYVARYGGDGMNATSRGTG